MGTAIGGVAYQEFYDYAQAVDATSQERKIAFEVAGAQVGSRLVEDYWIMAKIVLETLIRNR